MEDRDAADRVELERRTGACWLALSVRERNDALWTYDIAERRLCLYSMTEDGVRLTRTFDDMPAQLLGSGFVHPDSIEAVRELFEGIEGGSRHGSVTAAVANRGHGSFAWCALIYRTVCGDDGAPVRAVGVRRELDDPQNVRYWREAIPHALYPTLVRAGIMNLSAGHVESLFVRDAASSNLLKDISYRDACKVGSDSLYLDRERGAYDRLMDTDALVERYRSGRRWSVGFFRMVAGGTVTQTRVAVNVQRNARGHYVASTYANSCRTRGRMEANTDMTVMRDPDTMLYRRPYADLLARTALNEAPRDSLASVSLIRAFDDGGTPTGLMRDMATALGVFLGTESIVFAYGPHALAVVIVSIESAEGIARALDSAFGAARASLRDVRTQDDAALSGVHLVAGSVYGPARMLNLQSALKNAERLCLYREGSGSDTVMTPVPITSFTSGVAVERPEAVRVATGAEGAELELDEAREASATLAAMLSAPSPSASIHTALAAIGHRYRARRAYVIAASRADNLLTVLYEWYDVHATSVQESFSGSPLTRFPFIMGHLDATDPVVIEKPRSFSRGTTDADDRAPWRFAMLPVDRSAGTAVMLCVDDPARSDIPWTFASRLAGTIAAVWRKCADANGAGADRSARPALADASELDRVLDHTGSGTWASLGAIVVRVPGAYRAVRRRGISFTHDELDRIQEALTEVRRGRLCFRSGDTEFVALVPDLPHPEFIRLAARVRSSLIASSELDVQVGAAWSESTGAYRAVLEEARAVAALDDAKSPKAGAPVAGPRAESRAAAPDPLAERTELERRLVLYLQPKIDVTTGKIVGAEALARVLDDEGRATLPAGEIERLERSGDISAFDYCIFDRALALMDGWRERGLTVIPLSSNFSRTTLASSTSLASVLAILSRYPDVDPAQVEMEVTETAIDLGTSTLNELVERYHGLGLRVALDDFGSHYSNAQVLADVPFDTIKLDRSIIGGLPDNPVSRLMVKSIVDICSSRNMDCVAEGIESLDQAKALESEGCTCCQGFYYDKPLPVDLFEQKYLVA